MGAGAVRRQTVVSSGRPLKFPRSEESQNPMKVDIFKPIASGYLVMRPGEEQYKVLLSGVGGMTSALSCELKVTGEGASKAVNPVSIDDALSDPHRSEAVLRAQEYLDKHSLTDFVHKVLSTVVKERPADPYEAMARHFSSGYGVGEVRCSRLSLSQKTQELPFKPHVTAKVSRVAGDEERPDAGETRGLASCHAEVAEPAGKLNSRILVAGAVSSNPASETLSRTEDKGDGTKGYEVCRDVSQRKLPKQVGDRTDAVVPVSESESLRAAKVAANAIAEAAEVALARLERLKFDIPS